MGDNRGIIYTAADGSSDNHISIVGESLSSSVNMTHGETTNNMLVNGSYDAWVDSTTPWFTITANGAFSATGGEISKETDIVNTIGGASLKIVRTATNKYISCSANLLASTEYTYSFYHREEQTTAGAIKYSIKEMDPAPDNFLQNDGSWSTTSNLFSIDLYENTWTQVTKTFTTNAAGRYYFTIEVSKNGTWIFDDVSLIPSGGVDTWTVHSGDTYTTDARYGAVTSIAKCSTSEFSSIGFAALNYTKKASSLANCIATAGTWWYESGKIYYHLESGETIETVHIEANGRYLIKDTTDSVIQCRS